MHEKAIMYVDVNNYLSLPLWLYIKIPASEFSILDI